jgi:hypothetical protein
VPATSRTYPLRDYSTVGDLGQLWDREEDAARLPPDLTDPSRPNEAGDEPKTNTHVPDTTIGVIALNSSQLTLPVQSPFTAADFHYFDPGWLEPRSQPPLEDSNEEQEGDYEDNGYQDTEDEDASDEDDYADDE